MKYQKRICFLYCFLVFSISLLVARLYNLSKDDTNKSMAVLDGQYTGRITVCERSGFIYDRNGRLVSHDVSEKVALINPAECKNALLCAEKLSKYALVSSASEVYEKIMEGIPFTVCLADDGEMPKTEGVYVFDTYRENYSVAKHFLGYNNTDGEGVSGLRGAYNELLSNCLYSRVSASFDTNAKRMSLSAFNLETQKYLSRDGVVTTLDKELQEFCDGLCDEIKSGAVVAANVKTGEILALSSFPQYDINNLAQVLSSDKGEFINRAKESFTPGSAFKTVVAAAALETDKLLFEMKYKCTGSVEVEGHTFKCHKKSGHGEIDMTEAFAESCNTYFINLGQIIGIEAIDRTCKGLGLDKPNRADFLEETANYYPDTVLESMGYLANISFGQGDLCLSPLDMIKTVIAASTGYSTPLSSVLGEIKDGEFVSDEKEGKKRIFSENTCEKLLIMMRKCVESGTGSTAKTYGVNTGGKTATAQTGRFDGEGVEYVHKWFCGVYPIENPRIAICVLCDNETDTNVSPSVVFGKICAFLLENNL